MPQKPVQCLCCVKINNLSQFVLLFQVPALGIMVNNGCCFVFNPLFYTIQVLQKKVKKSVNTFESYVFYVSIYKMYKKIPINLVLLQSWLT